MSIFSIFTMLGALALFLYGMKMMGDGLSKLAGSKLEALLEQMTSNKMKAVLLGTVVTAIIQSSSATTVMVVGFVNAGIMKLSQAVGIIMGANIGTTITSWLLSLTGVESSNLLIQLVKPSTFAPLLAVVGIVLLLFCKGKMKQDIGAILLGFSILMFGMETMSEQVKPLANEPRFTQLFTLFENPILGMLVGAFVTAIIQSSSASVGILQAVCVTGAVSVSSAFYIIMGQNIGTCVTALLSSIGAKRGAKRAAFIHLYFNLIGTVIFMTAFYGIHTFFPFSFYSNTASAATIAILHSVFNVCSTLLLLPCTSLLERLALLTIPQKEDEKEEMETNPLEDRFLEHPSFALEAVKKEIFLVAKLIEEGMKESYRFALKGVGASKERVVAIEDDVDKKQDRLNVYMGKMTTQALSEKNHLDLSRYQQWITDLERISDYEKSLVLVVSELKESFSKSAKEVCQVVFEAVDEIIESTVHCVVHEDKQMALQIQALSDVISQMKIIVKAEQEKRLEREIYSVRLGMAIQDMMTSFNRMAKHCVNIAKESIREDDLSGSHDVAKKYREENELYKAYVALYSDQFVLPLKSVYTSSMEA